MVGDDDDDDDEDEEDEEDGEERDVQVCILFSASMCSLACW